MANKDNKMKLQSLKVLVFKNNSFNYMLPTLWFRLRIMIELIILAKDIWKAHN